MDAIKFSLRTLQVILILLWMGNQQIHAQNPLERRVTIAMKNAKVSEVLKQIEASGNLTFSYNPEQVRDDRKVDALYQSKPVRFILDRLFKGWIDYRTKGNYIILQPTRNPPVPEPKFQKVRISGYVLDKESGDYLRGVSIYDTIAFHSAVSDGNGHFEMELDEDSDALYLIVKKEGYLDTSYFIPRDAFQSVELALSPTQAIPVLTPIISSDSLRDQPELKHEADTGGSDWKSNIKQDFKEIGGFLNEKLRFNSINIKDTFFRKTQFSFVPGISTNGLMAGSVVNNYSFSLIGGYAQGVNVLELAGVFNLDKGDVSYFQAAGVFNMVGGNARGMQAAGVFNYTKGDIYGFQAAGLFNHTDENVLGMQAAGLFNNSKGNVFGMQAAGLFNHAGNINGVQAAGLYNRAKRVKGVQIGLFNVADSMRGLPIGLFSFVKKGYHKWEIGADELFYTRTSFRSGTHWFHNIIQAGIDPRTIEGEQPLWFVGYGIGTSLPLGRSFLDIDVTASHISKGYAELDLSELGQVYLGLDLYVAKKFSIAGGFTANAFFVSQEHPGFGETFNPLYSKAIFNENLDAPYKVQGWFGWKAAIRFF